MPALRFSWQRESNRSTPRFESKLPKMLPPQKFCGGHPTLSLGLNVGQRQRVIQRCDYQLAISSQNFARLAVKINNRRGKDLQSSIIEFAEGARPGIVGADSSYDHF